MNFISEEQMGMQKSASGMWRVLDKRRVHSSALCLSLNHFPGLYAADLYQKTIKSDIEMYDSQTVCIKILQLHHILINQKQQDSTMHIIKLQLI